MAKEFFRGTKFRDDSADLIDACNNIITNYMGQGLRLTLRQLYYQLVTQNTIKNEERAYKALSGLVSDGRLAGLIDWDAIEDRIRIPSIPAEWNDLADLVDSALDSYRLPRWEGQDNYIELWVEKDALAGVLRPLARRYHVTMMVNRGYSSQSAMYEASKRLIEQDGKERYILYLGDFDPSGEDMVRDIRDRLDLFGAETTVEKIALTLAQVKKYKPPPNPAKRKDPRSRDFIQKFGASSWEVDAIDPAELQRIVRGQISRYVDMRLMNAVIAKEEEDKKKLKQAVQKL